MYILSLHCIHHQNVSAQSILYKVWLLLRGVTKTIQYQFNDEEKRTRDILVLPKVLDAIVKRGKKEKKMSRPRITKVLHRDHSKKGAIMFWPLVGT
jgi:hypothetical protein